MRIGNTEKFAVIRGSFFRCPHISYNIREEHPHLNLNPSLSPSEPPAPRDLSGAKARVNRLAICVDLRRFAVLLTMPHIHYNHDHEHPHQKGCATTKNTRTNEPRPPRVPLPPRNQPRIHLRRPDLRKCPPSPDPVSCDRLDTTQCGRAGKDL